MGAQEDYATLADRLITHYTKGVLERAIKVSKKKVRASQSDARIIQSISSISDQLARYNDPHALDAALDAIDLAKIYEGVDKREKEHSDKLLGYEDFVVLETLRYFKNDFFTWVNKPKCGNCHQDGDNIEFIGGAAPPSPNPDEISRIEVYRCKTCNSRVEFPRLNSPVKLLETRRGRCGEWVNCFMLILRAVLSTNGAVRYIWNHEDHVWCEYYSESRKEWIHLDPCENAFDEPGLYCENWGKKMSWVVAINDFSIVDVSDKYITDEEKRIPKLTVASEKSVLDYLHWANDTILVRYWIQNIEQLPLTDHEKYLKLYNEAILKHNRDTLKTEKSLKSEDKPTLAETSSAPKGRQSGKGEWTKTRGEDGS